MARALITDSGLGVKIRLSFEEAAALLALLRRVGDDTNVEINEATFHLWGQLSEVRSCVDSNINSEWPTEFDDFGNNDEALVDPGA